jgi:hypothetical protein
MVHDVCILLTLRCFVLLLLVVVIGEGGIQRPALSGLALMVNDIIGCLSRLLYVLKRRCRLCPASNTTLNHCFIPASAETSWKKLEGRMDTSV